MLDLQHAFLGIADHSIQMLTDGDVAFVAAEAVYQIAVAYPVIGRAMWLETLAEGSIFGSGLPISDDAMPEVASRIYSARLPFVCILPG